MSNQRPNNSVEALIRDLDRRLAGFEAERSGLTLRAKVLRLVEFLDRAKDLGVRVVREHGLDAGASRERIRLYLIEYKETPVSSKELEVVAGISEYARRVRELRREQGYKIATGDSPDPETGVDLARDEYMLISEEPDLEAASRWHVANRIRRSGASSRGRLLEFLKENVGKIVTTEELAYVAKDRSEFGRRVRELRTQDGWAIATRFTGRPDLASGEYVLENLERVAEPHDRRIPHALQREVYGRDSNACRLCGWNRANWKKSDPRILELHHLRHHQDRGPNRASNLIVICSRCHDQVHSGTLTIPFAEA